MSAAPMSAPARGVTVRLDAIEIPSTTRPYNATAVVELSRSIAAIGLQSAPTVIERGRGYLLVAGRHRIEALKLLGRETVFARLADMDDLQARIWTISEKLHRAELPALQRAEQMAESSSFPIGRGTPINLRNLRQLKASGLRERGFGATCAKTHRPPGERGQNSRRANSESPRRDPPRAGRCLAA